jgi:TolB protein
MIRLHRPTRSRRALAVVVHGLALAGGLGGAAAAAAAQDTTARQGVSLRLQYGAQGNPGLMVLPVNGPGGDSVRAIIQRDLGYGDRVNVVMGDATVPLTNGRPNYDLFKRLGAVGVVQASITASGGLHVALHDVGARAVTLVRDFALPPTANSAEWRMAVHGASDEIERWATGTRGIAQTRILFVRGRRVHVVDSDGENVRAVTDGSSLSPTWHRDGRRFAYSTLTDQGAQQIVIREIGGGAQVVASAPVTNMTPAISPDGSTIVYAHGQEAGVDLYAVGASGGGSRRVTVGRGSDNMSPSFSPDGRRIAFASGRSGHPEVYISDADGTNAELLTAYAFGDQNYRSNPDWSPDGRLVAFQSLIGGTFQVMTIGLRDRAVKQLTRDGRNEDPSWAPDSRHVVVTSTRGGSQQLWVVDAETGKARQLTRGAAARMGAWSPVLGRAP